METNCRYDCIECGHTNCVTVIENAGYCNTDGCVINHPVQYVFYPDWKKPKTSRAGREVWWEMIPHQKALINQTVPPSPR